MKTEKLVFIITQTDALMNVTFFWDYFRHVFLLKQNLKRTILRQTQSL